MSSLRPRFRPLLAGVLGTCILAPAQVAWVRRNPTVFPWSSGNSGFQLCYDIASGRSMVFGGYSGSVWATTCEWTGYEWLSGTATPGPTRRAYYAATSLWPKPGVLMHGGWNSATFAETWSWSAGTWAGPLATGPSARWLHA